MQTKLFQSSFVTHSDFGYKMNCVARMIIFCWQRMHLHWFNLNATYIQDGANFYSDLFLWTSYFIFGLQIQSLWVMGIRLSINYPHGIMRWYISLVGLIQPRFGAPWIGSLPGMLNHWELITEFMPENCWKKWGSGYENQRQTTIKYAKKPTMPAWPTNQQNRLHLCIRVILERSDWLWSVSHWWHREWPRPSRSKNKWYII